MSNASTHTTEQDAITHVLQHYIDGAKSGRGDDMKPAFHEDATIFGYVGDDLFAGPIQKLFEWNDDNGPATGLQARIADIDLAGTVATVRLELENWTGHRFHRPVHAAQTRRRVEDHEQGFPPAPPNDRPESSLTGRWERFRKPGKTFLRRPSSRRGTRL